MARRGHSGAPKIAFSRDGSELAAEHTDENGRLYLRVFRTEDWRLNRELPGPSPGAALIADTESLGWVGLYRRKGQLELQAYGAPSAVWSASPFPPPVDWTSDRILASNVGHLEIAAAGSYLAAYELLQGENGQTAYSLVLRRTSDGRVTGVYDLPGLADLSISPDGSTIAYHIGLGQSYTALVQAPR
ncbi:MAG TPA: hypothetical protein VFV10_19325 [Gammaproteobacteria bacterium]|nr:hypothetical protein [Gammaproteobacteria bacterium]